MSALTPSMLHTPGPSSTDSVKQRCEQRIGAVLRGKYRLDRLIGVGGMAAVYSATHRNGHRVAVKTLHPEFGIDESTRQRFLREGYVANKVEHRGVVRVLDDDVSEDGTVYLVMELLHGETIDSIWTRHEHKLPVRAVLCIAHQLMDVLAAAHARGVVHRDVKPGNVFLCSDGQVKVLDFGIARLRDASEGSMLTLTGVAMGTPAFMSPEQALGKMSLVDGQSDVWSAGATIFVLLSGHLVHAANTVQEMVVFAATKHGRSLSIVDPEVPREVVAMVDKALAFEKKDRWASAAVMRDAIRDAYVELFREPITALPLASFASERQIVIQTSPNSDAFAQTAATPSAPAAHEVSQTRPSTAPKALIGTTTAQPLSRDPARAMSPHVTAPKLLSARRAVWGSAIGLLLMAAIGVAVLVATKRPAPEPAAQGATTVVEVPGTALIAPPTAATASSATTSTSPAIAPAPPPATAPATTRPRVTAKPPSTSTRPPKDPFDHQ